MVRVSGRLLVRTLGDAVAMTMRETDTGARADERERRFRPDKRGTSSASDPATRSIAPMRSCWCAVWLWSGFVAVSQRVDELLTSRARCVAACPLIRHSPRS